MAPHGLAVKVLIGMVSGILIGLALMHYVPAGIQPGDVLEVHRIDGTTELLKVADVDRAERTIEILIDEVVPARAVLETPQTAGTARLPDGTEVLLMGVSFERAPEMLTQAGFPADRVELESRKAVTVRPAITQVFYVIGEFFVRLLRLIVIPLIVATVLVGISSLGSMAKLGKLGKQTFLFYFATMLVASCTGLFMVNLIRPGAGLNWPMPETPGGGIADTPGIPDLILRIVDKNPIQAMADFDVLGILFFTILLGIAILTLGKHKAAPIFNFFESLQDLMFVIVRWVMRLAPIGVGALIAYYIGVQNPAHLGTLAASLGLFAATVASSLTIHFCFLLALVWFLGTYSPKLFIQKLMPAIATAFGTNSSNATMPMTLASVRTMGVSKRISGFVVPVGATMNMDGTALFEAVAVLFFAQAYLGADLTIAQQVIVALTAILAAVGAAGIPSAGLITMALVLTAVGLPLAGIGLLFAIDRPLDMLRTVVNITGDAVTSRVVQTWNPDIDPDDDDLATEYEIVEPAAAHGD
jgi:Na+/H+-dicarboxylate symporter